jgi:hypothetical protein
MARPLSAQVSTNERGTLAVGGSRQHSLAQSFDTQKPANIEQPMKEILARGTLGARNPKFKIIHRPLSLNSGLQPNYPYVTYLTRLTYLTNKCSALASISTKAK